MKERGAESDEDVGLGLDFEEDDDEFRKCIEDDVPGAGSLCAAGSLFPVRRCEKTDEAAHAGRRCSLVGLSLLTTPLVPDRIARS